VKFFAGMFKHAFYESSSRRVKNKALFARERARRINWIRFVIESDQAEVYETIHHNGLKRRLSLIIGGYLVIIQLEKNRPKQARFITAYVHDNPDRVRHDPKNTRIHP
jgi:hypothetical protein